MSMKLTTSAGCPVADNQNSLTAGARAPREIQLCHIYNCLKADPAHGKGFADALGIALEAET